MYITQHLYRLAWALVAQQCDNYQIIWLAHFTHTRLASFFFGGGGGGVGGINKNSADPDQIPQNADSDQGLHRLLTECSIKVLDLNVKYHPTALKTEIDWSS